MNRTALETKKRKLIKFLIRLLTLALVVGGIFLLGYYIFSLLGGKTKLREDIQKWTKENTFLGCFIYLVLSPVINLIPGISSIFFITLANRMLNDKTPLGRLYSFLLCDSSVMLTTVLLFLVGRTIGKKAIGWLIGEEDYQKAKDKISESLILKSFQAIPGVGRLGQGAGEIMLGCAMLIKNSVGMAAIIVLFFIVLTPLVKTLIFSLMYRLLSAALQPVSDNRIVEGIEAVARAGNLYYIVIRDASILFFIVIAIVCASTSFMGG